MPSLPREYFDRLYAIAPDPWNFAASPYEKAKYAATLAAMPAERYASALEIGCSIGVLTEMLANRCDALVGVDVAQMALAQARARNAHQPHVSFELGQFPHEIPVASNAGFDLIVLSEMLYYLDRPTLVDAAFTTLALSRPGADILLVHWLGPTPDYPLTGEQATEHFIAALLPDAEVISQSRHPNYRIDLLRRQ